MNLLDKLGAIIKSRQMRIPVPTRFPRIGLPKLLQFPKVSLGQGKVKYVIGGSVLLSSTVVTVGLIFAVYDVASATFEFPKPGAVYQDLHTGGTMGEPLPPYADGTESQTLKMLLASGARLSSLNLSDIEIGATGLTTACFSIQRAATNTTGFLNVDQFTVDGLIAPTMIMGNTEVNTLNVTAQVDGGSNNVTIDSTISDMTIMSEREAGDFVASPGTVVDRILIEFLGEAYIKSLSVTDVNCSISTAATGAIDWDHIKAGNMTMGNVKVGTGTGVNSADFTLDTTVKAKSYTSQIVDTPITVK